MGKNSKRQQAEQTREYRLRREQEAREKQKQENKIILIVAIAIVAVALIAAGIPLVISLVNNASKGEPIITPADTSYVESAETTDYVKLTIRYTDSKGVYRQGDVIVELRPDAAPITVANFQKLVSEEFYDNTPMHRIISGFMIQGGDPDGDGRGGSSETIYGEFESNGWENPLLHERGVISMARTGDDPDSASSQFFIMHETSPHLDGDYAAFGKVVSGMDTVDGIAGTEVTYNSSYEKSVPVNPVTVVSAVFVQKVG